MRLIHNAKDNLLIMHIAARQLVPELLELRRRRRSRVTRVTNDGSGRWLLRRIVVPHVVVRVQDGVDALGLRDVVDGVVEVAKV